MVKCPKCHMPLDVEEDELDEGDTLTCEECGATVAVAGLEPLEMEIVDEEDEDEDSLDDDDEDEDEDEEEEEEDWK